MDHSIVVDGVKIAYTLSGEGKSIALLHGWMCNRTFWKEQIEFLSKTHRVLAPDFRGHGGSGSPEVGYTMERLAEDVYNLLMELGLKKVVVVGHSMGGMVAQQLCVQHMECVSGLILVTTIAADVEDQLISKRIEAESGTMGFREAFMQYFDGWFGTETDRRVVDGVRKKMLQTPEHVGLSLVHSYRRFDLRVHLPTFRMPTLVVGAGADASAVPVESQMLADLIPGARLAMIERCGHFPMVEMPQALNQLLGEFLETNGL